MGLALGVFILVCGSHVESQETKQLYPVKKDDKTGFIDQTGKVIIPIQFDSVGDFHDGLCLVTKGPTKLFIDTSGKVIFKAPYDIVNDFSEGLAAVNIGQTRIANVGLIANPGKWGYIDRTGKLVMPLKFTHAEDFSEGLAAVTDGGRGRFIDHSGKAIFEVPFDVTLGFHEGIVGVLFHGDVTYVDRNGKKISPPIDYGPKSYSFSEGLVPIGTKDKWGFMDQTGRLAIDAQFEAAESFREGLAPVKIKGDLTWCPADESGSRSGTTLRYGFIDKSGKLVIPPQFESAEGFSEGLAEVRNCGRAFFIDRNGKTVISGNFTYASSFSGGLARVTVLKDSELLDGYIDRAGKFVWQPSK